MARNPTDIVPWQVRMRAKLHTKLVDAAKHNGISINQEVVNRLEDSFDADAQRNSVSALLDVVSGDPSSAQILKMIGHALKLATFLVKSVDGPDNPERYAAILDIAFGLILSKHLGIAIDKPMTQEELAKLYEADEPRATGVMIADTVLVGEGYSRVIEEIEPKISPLKALFGLHPDYAK